MHDTSHHGFLTPQNLRAPYVIRHIATIIKCFRPCRQLCSCMTNLLRCAPQGLGRALRCSGNFSFFGSCFFDIFGSATNNTFCSSSTTTTCCDSAAHLCLLGKTTLS